MDNIAWLDRPCNPVKYLVNPGSWETIEMVLVSVIEMGTEYWFILISPDAFGKLRRGQNFVSLLNISG